MAEDKLLIIKLAHHYHEFGYWDKAIIEYEKLEKMDPADVKTTMSLGEVLLKKGDLERAYEKFEAAAQAFLVKKNTMKAAGAFKEVAHLIQKMVEPKDPNKAIQMYEAILKQLPESPDTMTCLRMLYGKQSNKERAIFYTLELAELYNRMDYIEKAEEEYVRATTLAPDRADIREKLEKLRQEMSQLNNAPPAANS
jgi:tetratricopeptide (TPR) repeat protein